MIETSAEFQSAIVGSPRKTDLIAIVDLSDPDMTWGEAASNGFAPWSKPEQLHDKEFDAPPRYQTLELNRLLLDGSTVVFPEEYKVPGIIGTATEQISRSDGTFSPAAWIKQPFKNVRVLQMLSVFFSDDPLDGVPIDFTVDVYSGNAVYFTKEFTGNTETKISISGFTVYSPTAIRVTCTKMSLPSRRLRIMEILTGLYEKWGTSILSSFTCTQQGEFSCLSLPYSSINLSMDNKDKRFEPRRKDGIFQSIEERQGVDVYIGVRLPSGGYEHVRLGLFYMAGDGWKTGSNDLTMNWYLVDIIGLLTDRTFIPPVTLPTTLGGWMEAIVSQLGENFSTQWSADPNYVNKTVTANNREDVTGKKCGDMIRWVCQATETWPRADAETGKLCAEPLWNQGSKIDLDNLNTYPTMKANESLAALIFNLTDGTQDVISGNSTSSVKTVTIQNPFLHTHEQALAASKLILAQYGGNQLEITGRGNPSSEIGDADTVWIDESNATSARRMNQTFQFQNGVLQNCKVTLLQADRSYLWEGFEVIKQSGIWKSPPGVRRLRIVLGQAGQGGGYGKPGYVEPFKDPVTGQLANKVFSGYGESGQDGQGGMVWYGTIDCSEGQEFQVNLGAGGLPATKPGVPGEIGEHTTFGIYSSENGKIYEYGYTDIANGQVFARTGVAAPLPGTGDGGKGGPGGEPGAGYLYQNAGDIGYRYQQTKDPGPGKPGVAGATGFAMATWDKEEADG